MDAKKTSFLLYIASIKHIFYANNDFFQTTTFLLLVRNTAYLFLFWSVFRKAILIESVV